MQDKQTAKVKIFYDNADEEDEEEIKRQSVKRLTCGATYVKTEIGPIQFGMPPGFLTELVNLNLEVPQYFIIPTSRFHKRYAINLADFQQISLHNFLRKKKTFLITNPFAAEHIKNVFRELYPKWSKQKIDPIVDFYSSIDKNPIPDFEQEITYIQNMITNHNKEFPFDEMIEFIIIDKKTNEVTINNQITIKKRQDEFMIFHDEREIATISDKIDIDYVVDVNWDDELKKKFDIDDLVAIGQKIKGPRNVQSSSKETPFGITFLPKLNNDSVSENSLGFIIWINGRGVLVDPPIFTSQILTKLQISSSLIEWIIITQSSFRNDTGAFQILFENSNVEIITTRQIYQTFIKKYSDLSSMPMDFLIRILKFRPVSIGAVLVLKSCKFKFFYNLNLIPSIGFEAVIDNQTLYFAGESLLNTQTLQEMLKNKALTQDRYNQITTSKWKNAQFIVMYAGGHNWNTSIETLNQIKEQYPEFQKKSIILSTEEQLCKILQNSGYQIPSNNIDSCTYIDLTDKKVNKIKNIDYELVKKRELQKKIDLLCTIEIFESISIKNFRDLLQSAKEEYYEPGEFIIKQGSIGTKFYFVMSGIVCIYNNNRTLKRFCPSGSYFGETALKVESTQRGANVLAVKYTELLSLEKQDFWFIFGEERDEAAPIIQKLLSIYTSRRKNTVNLLKKNSLFREINEQQKTELEMIFKEAKFETNKIIWTKGEEARFAIFIKEGAIKFSDCPEQNLSEMGEGYFIGEIDCIINDKPLTTSLISLKLSEVFLIDKVELLHFFKKNLGILLKINYLKYFN